jgi:hypothetical protein
VINADFLPPVIEYSDPVTKSADLMNFSRHK